jgi:hypothetical protein
VHGTCGVLRRPGHPAAPKRRIGKIPVQHRRLSILRRCRSIFEGGILAAFLLLAMGCSAPPAPPAPNQDPVANAGPDQTVDPGTQVVLDGSSSFDPDEDILTYSWRALEDNPSVVLFEAQKRRISFSVSASGTYQFSLTVTDTQNNTSDPSIVTIVVRGDDNTQPIADILLPDGSRFEIDQILLDGSGSFDPDGDALSYLWEVEGPDSNDSGLADATVQQAVLRPPTSGNYRIRLTVSDGKTSATEEITITIQLPDNQSPLADAGPDTLVLVGDLVTLDGSGSTDPDGDQLSYNWSVGTTPGAAVSLSNPTTAQPTFTPTEPGDYSFALVVNDGVASSLQAIVKITVEDQVFQEQDGMVEVAAGVFQMGSDADDALLGEAPSHPVDLSGYWIDDLC